MPQVRPRKPPLWRHGGCVTKVLLLRYRCRSRLSRKIKGRLSFLSMLHIFNITLRIPKYLFSILHTFKIYIPSYTTSFPYHIPNFQIPFHTHTFHTTNRISKYLPNPSIHHAIFSAPQLLLPMQGLNWRKCDMESNPRENGDMTQSKEKFVLTLEETCSQSQLLVKCYARMTGAISAVPSLAPVDSRITSAVAGADLCIGRGK